MAPITVAGQREIFTPLPLKARRFSDLSNISDIYCQFLFQLYLADRQLYLKIKKFYLFPFCYDTHKLSKDFFKNYYCDRFFLKFMQ